MDRNQDMQNLQAAYYYSMNQHQIQSTPPVPQFYPAPVPLPLRQYALPGQHMGYSYGFNPYFPVHNHPAIINNGGTVINNNFYESSHPSPARTSVPQNGLGSLQEVTYQRLSYMFYF